MIEKLHAFLQKHIVQKRMPDIVIGGTDAPYLFRWYVIPRNPVLNIYLHQFLRSDDDRALHDHPWINASLLLEGEYIEHLVKQGGIHELNLLQAGDIRIRLSGKIAHRVELTKSICWTLFITGPRYREWGFHCPDRGWVHRSDFTSEDGREVGKGCNQ